MAFLADIRRAFTAAWAPALASPWQPHPSHLESWLWSDIFDTEHMPMTRAEAMTVPAMARARNLVCATIAQDELRAYRDGDDVTDSFIWLRRTDGDLSWFHELLWTCDDLLFNGWSLWWVDRDRDGRVIRTRRVNPARWSLDRDGAITVDGGTPPAASVCLIPGISEGILSFGAGAIRLATKLARAAGNTADTPSPTLELHQTGGEPLTQTEIRELREQWAEARRGKFAGVAYTNATLETKEHRAASEHLLVEGRNASDVEMARLANVSATLLDATAHKASLNYENREGRASELADFGLAPYMAAISRRLSLDDMTPRGTVTRFTLEQHIGAQHVTPTDAPGPALPTAVQPAVPGAPNRLAVIEGGSA